MDNGVLFVLCEPCGCFGIHCVVIHLPIHPPLPTPIYPDITTLSFPLAFPPLLFFSPHISYFPLSSHLLSFFLTFLSFHLLSTPFFFLSPFLSTPLLSFFSSSSLTADQCRVHRQRRGSMGSRDHG